MVYNEIVKIVGEKNVTKDYNSKLVYSGDASRETGEPKLIVWPNNITQIQEIVKLAKQKYLDVVCRGSGTGLVGGAVPKQSIVLCMSKMNKIIEKKENTVIVETGIILDELNYQLKDSFLPVIPASHAVCTIGGMIACNAAGTRTIKYGKMDNWVNKITIIDGNGRRREINNTKKFCGSEGTLGVIVNAELKITKPIKKITMELYKMDNPEEVIQKIKTLQDKTIISTELLCPKTSELLELEPRYHLFIEYEGIKGEIKDLIEIKKWERIRENAYPRVASNNYPYIQDPIFKDSKSLIIFMNYLEKEKIPFFGHVGIGILHPCLNEEINTDDFYKKVIECKGKVSGEHGIGLVKKKFVTTEEKNELLFQKKQFDPDNIMNRRKIV